MKRIMTMVFVGMFLFSGMAYATLTTIGTASYDSDGDGTLEEYNLIYMDDGPFGPITWLDYTNSANEWEVQVDWATGIGAELTVNLYDGYTTDTDWSTGWRLPETDGSQVNFSGYFGYEGPDENGYYDYRWGYNMVNSEMGYLYYEELGNKGYYAEDGTFPQPGYGLNDTGDFDNLLDYYYWSGTEYGSDPSDAWVFYFHFGSQGNDYKDDYDNIYAIAVHSEEVYFNAVPEPCTLLLLGTGLIGLAGVRRRVKS